MSNNSVDKATIGLFNLQIVAKRKFYLLEMDNNLISGKIGNNKNLY